MHLLRSLSTRLFEASCFGVDLVSSLIAFDDCIPFDEYSSPSYSIGNPLLLLSMNPFLLLSMHLLLLFTLLFNKHTIPHFTDIPSLILPPNSPTPTSVASAPHILSPLAPSAPQAARRSDSSTASYSRSARSISASHSFSTPTRNRISFTMFCFSRSSVSQIRFVAMRGTCTFKSPRICSRRFCVASAK